MLSNNCFEWVVNRRPVKLLLKFLNPLPDYKPFSFLPCPDFYSFSSQIFLRFVGCCFFIKLIIFILQEIFVPSSSFYMIYFLTSLKNIIVCSHSDLCKSEGFLPQISRVIRLLTRAKLTLITYILGSKGNSFQVFFSEPHIRLFVLS